MKNFIILLFLSLPACLTAQLITEEQLSLMVKNAQEETVGAHENVVLRTNETFAKKVWGQNIRFNQAKIVKFFSRPSGEKASPGFDIHMNNKGKVGYTYDPKSAADLLSANGVRTSSPRNEYWINARQNLLYAEGTMDGSKIILELYCPYQEFLELLRIGKNQSIEFLMIGFSGSVSGQNKIHGVLTRVNTEKQTIQCSNGHEFDSGTGYKFCPECGKPLD